MPASFFWRTNLAHSTKNVDRKNTQVGFSLPKHCHVSHLWSFFTRSVNYHNVYIAAPCHVTHSYSRRLILIFQYLSQNNSWTIRCLQVSIRDQRMAIFANIFQDPDWWRHHFNSEDSITWERFIVWSGSENYSFFYALLIGVIKIGVS